jgi:thymidylate synthase (FAD)
MEKIQILDHGYIGFVESWGSDERVVEAARMSTNKGFQGWGEICSECGWAKGDDHEVGCSHPERWKAGDEKLLRYLYEHEHHTPFEMAGMVIEVQAPIFVFREWHRHRTQSYNEMSARYTPLPDVNYIPTVERLMMNAAATNRQANRAEGAAPLLKHMAVAYRDALERSYDDAEELYQWALKAGVPKELARVHLPVGRYSRMRASANLRNWLGFLTLRTANDAQWEIRCYANAVGSLIEKCFPRTYSLFQQGISQ